MDATELPRLIEAPLYCPSPGDRIRVVVQYGGTWRPVFWLKVGKDGSVYCGPRFTSIATLRKGSKFVQEGRVSIKYEEGQEVTDPALRKSAKTSFHATGIVNAAGDRLYRDPLRTIKEQQELCWVLFQHPSQYSPASKIEDRDICLNYDLDERRPLQGSLFVAPSDKWRIVRIQSATNQINLLLAFSKLTGCPDLLVQFILHHGVTGPWPPYTYLVFGTDGTTMQ